MLPCPRALQDVCVSCLELINNAPLLNASGSGTPNTNFNRRRLLSATAVQVATAVTSMCPNASSTTSDPVLPAAVVPTSVPPDAVDDLYLCPFNQMCSVPATGVLANDSTPNAGGTLVVVGVVTPPPIGTLLLARNGSFTYTPPPGFHGVVNFEYAVSDGVDPVNVTATGWCPGHQAASHSQLEMHLVACARASRPSRTLLPLRK